MSTGMSSPDDRNNFDGPPDQQLTALFAGSRPPSRPLDVVKLLRENVKGTMPQRERTRSSLLTQPRGQRLPTTGRSVETASPWNRITRWNGRLTMRQRIALGGIGAAAALGLLFVLAMSLARPVSAMEKMAEEVRKAKSFKCTATGKTTFVFKLGDPPHTRETRMVEYWLAPDVARIEFTDPSRWRGPGPERVKIAPGGNRPWLVIDNRVKTYCFHAPSDKDWVGTMKSHSPDSLGRLYGEADRELGTKEINGKKAHGFVIGIKKDRSRCTVVVAAGNLA